MQERLSFLSDKQNLACLLASLHLPIVQFTCGTHFPIFWTFPMACSRMEMAAWESSCGTQLFGKHFLRLGIVLVQKSLQLTSSTFLDRFSRFLSFRSKNCRHWTGEINLCTLFPIKHCRHRPPQAFDMIRQAISSNWNRKAKLSAYAFFLAFFLCFFSKN